MTPAPGAVPAKAAPPASGAATPAPGGAARIHVLSDEVARKIAAGEVIERPASVVRELMDNAVDSGATRIQVEITEGGIECVRVVDNGCGMTKADLEQCATPHATSKITSADDLLTCSSLGFRGEALSSMAAVGRLEITSGGYTMRSGPGGSAKTLEPSALTEGTIAQCSRLFAEFPARRRFLARAFSESARCRAVFEEKALPRPDIAFTFISDGEERVTLPACRSLKDRFVAAKRFKEGGDLFYAIPFRDSSSSFGFDIVIGESAVYRPTRRDIYIYVNGRRIQEYSLMQAIIYGASGYFPNGTFPVCALFVNIDPSLVDFNIHPAKREVRFKDIKSVHKAVSEAVRNFFKGYAIKSVIERIKEDEGEGYLMPDGGELEAREAEARGEAEGERPAGAREARFPLPYSYRMRDAARLLGVGTFAAGEKACGGTLPLGQAEEDAPSARGGNAPDGVRLVGKALGTFIIAEKDDVLYIIDQHAAHERIIYDALMRSAGPAQKLLVPYVIRTSRDEDDRFLRSELGSLRKVGFSVREKGGGEWEVTSVPVMWQGTAEDLRRDLLGARAAPGDIIKAVIASASCRRAVKDGTLLDDDTALALARGALALPDPHCPHGRPVFCALTKAALFKSVRRT